MQTTLTPALKWSIGILTVAFIGLGSWLGFVVYRNNHQPAEVATVLPAPVAASLSDAATTPANDDSTTADTSANTSKPATTKSTASAKTTTVAAQPAKHDIEPELAASIASTSMNGQVMITVVANQPVVAGFAPLSGSHKDSDFSQTKTMTVASFSGTKTMVLRTKAGQEQSFEISGTSTSVTASSQS